MLNLIKLGLYFSLVGHYRLDPMVFELINEERRMRERENAKAADKQATQTIEETDDDIRKAA